MKNKFKWTPKIHAKDKKKKQLNLEHKRYSQHHWCSHGLQNPKKPVRLSLNGLAISRPNSLIKF
uniref:Uncharacterized protein n=1 Tax=Arundo donax TaxID=35708 RepID=A0A0A8YXK8_ARUDO